MGQSEGSGEEDQAEKPEQTGTDIHLPEEILSTALLVRTSQKTLYSKVFSKKYCISYYSIYSTVFLNKHTKKNYEYHIGNVHKT